jgi:hypothetical protein
MVYLLQDHVDDQKHVPINLISLLSGHVIDKVPEIPLVVSDKVQEINKTKQAVIFLRRIKAWSDVLKVSDQTLLFIYLLLGRLTTNMTINLVTYSHVVSGTK